VTRPDTGFVTRDALYVYGIVRAGFDAARAPAGLDETTVVTRRGGGVAALVSRLGSGYAPADIEQQSGDVSWLSPRAMAHDRVLTWAQEHGGVIPLPMFSMWGNDAALEASLAAQSGRLQEVFERVANADEYGLRVYRRDDEALMKAVEQLEPEFAKMRREAEATSPGRRYLLERKVAELSTDATRRASKKMAHDFLQELQRLAREALARPLTPDASVATDATLVLNAAFLVERAALDAFRAAIAAVVQHHQPLGLTFDFTGPWPPYHFVADSGGSALNAGST
jgi:hypothetical protein